VLRGIGSAIGLLVYGLSAERRRITRINLKLCFPHLTETQRRQLARQCFYQSGQALMELAAIWFGPLMRLREAATVNGLNHIAAAKAQGRGVLLIGFHTNDLELGANALAYHIEKMAGMYRPHSNVVFEHAMRNGRERHFPLIARDDIRAAVKWIKAGGVLWYAPDQDYGAAQAVFAPFFSHPAATVTATTRFAKMANAVVIPMTHVRTTGGIAITLHAPLAIPGESELADATAVNGFLENYLREYPANYMWMHRRFKTQAPGKPSLYPERQAHRDRLSVRRYELYRKTGVELNTHSGATPCLFISVTHLFLVYPRQWWQPRSKALHELRQQLVQWQQQQIPTAQFDKQARCSARAVDIAYLKLPIGKPLAHSDLSDEQQQQLIKTWYQRFPHAPRNAAGFWLSEQNELYLLP
jgi:KDO2-lipid IV(A) lauroyltransferase